MQLDSGKETITGLHTELQSSSSADVVLSSSDGHTRLKELEKGIQQVRVLHYRASPLY